MYVAGWFFILLLGVDARLKGIHSFRRGYLFAALFFSLLGLHVALGERRVSAILLLCRQRWIHLLLLHHEHAILFVTPERVLFRGCVCEGFQHPSA